MSCPPSSPCSSSPSAAPCTFTNRGRSPRFRSAVSPLAKLVEAALFASARPLTVEELLTLDPPAGTAAVRAALAELREAFATGDHGVELIEIAQGWQFLTRREYAEAIDRAQFAQRPPNPNDADAPATRLGACGRDVPPQGRGSDSGGSRARRRRRRHDRHERGSAAPARDGGRPRRAAGPGHLARAQQACRLRGEP